MAHEHDGHCCGTQEQAVADLHTHAHNLGQQCMQGACSHVEHQGLQAQFMLEGQLESTRRELAESTSIVHPETKKKKKAKKRAGLSLSQLLLATN